MKKLIFLSVLFVCIVNFLFSTVFSQETSSYDVKSYKKNSIIKIYRSGSLMGYKPLISSSTADTTKPLKTKPWWETLLDFSFWSKLSGPGPFLGIGMEYPVFKLENIAVFIGGSLSNSIDNSLPYYVTITRKIIYPPDSTHATTVRIDSCIQCGESRAVRIVSLQLEVNYNIPRSNFDLFLGGGIHTFFGETFHSFSRISGSFGASWLTPLQYLRVGLMVNAFNRFKPDSFGAIGGDKTNSVEFIPGVFISVSLF